MADIFKFKIWCDTENKWVEGWFAEDPHRCPNDVTHTIDDVKTAVVEQNLDDDVIIANMATLQDRHKDVQRVVRQPGRTDHYMCDRDIKIKTSMVLDETCIEDKKINVTTNKEEDWGEFSLVGCFKEDVSGDIVLCTDQNDADVNAELTIVDYLAINQTTQAPLNYDFMGGCLWADNQLAEPVPGDKWKHRIYAVLAPMIPPSYGGGARFFDGYLYPYEGKWQEAINCMAIEINPDIPGAMQEAARVRFWLKYPKGAKNTHVLRIIAFRLPEAF